MTSKAKARLALKNEFWGTRVDNVNKLLDTCITNGHLKNDAALSRKLKVAPPVISKLRHGVLYPGASIVIRIYQDIGIPIEKSFEILNLSADFRF